MLIPNMRSLLELYGETFVNDLVEKMNELGLNSSGKGAASIRYDAADMSLEISSLKHVSAVDTGLNPEDFVSGRKPSTSKNGLDKWVRRTFKRMVPDLNDKELRRISFAVAKNIKNKGTIKRAPFNYNGANFVSFVINKQLNALERDISDLVLEDIDKTITLTIKSRGVKVI